MPAVPEKKTAKEVKTGVEFRIWLKQGEEKSLLARISKVLEEARKRLSRQKNNKKVSKFKEN